MDTFVCVCFRCSIHVRNSHAPHLGCFITFQLKNCDVDGKLLENRPAQIWIKSMQWHRMEILIALCCLLIIQIMDQFSSVCF